jgi:hypothetical protein
MYGEHVAEKVHGERRWVDRCELAAQQRTDTFILISGVLT